MPLLEIEGLRAGYGDAVVLSEVSLALEQGQSLSVLGRNGVGKTTLILAIMGQADVMKGSIEFAGRSLKATARSSRAALGLAWVPQERDIFPSLTVTENLRVGARPGPFDLKAIYSIMPRLYERRDNYGDQLSGGEQQMLAIGRSLLVNPRLLLLDEPFEGLAPIIVEEIAKLIRELNKEHGLSIVIVEQHAKAALALSDHAIVIERGQIVVRGASDDLLASFESLKHHLSV